MTEEEFGRVPIRMEEEEEGSPPPTNKRGIGFVVDDGSSDLEKPRYPSRVNEAYIESLRALVEERKTILNPRRNSQEGKASAA